MNCSTCRFADIAGHHEPCHTCMIAVERGRGFSMYEAHSVKVEVQRRVNPPVAVEPAPWKLLDAALRGAA